MTTTKKSAKKGGKRSKKKGASKATAGGFDSRTRAALDISTTAGATNGKRTFIQLDVRPSLKEGVDKFIEERGFKGEGITVSQIGRVLFAALVLGKTVHIKDVPSFHRAKAALSEG